MKDSEQARGTPLKGLAVKVADGFFLIGLSAVDSDVQSNIDLLKTREWFDIPIIYTNGGRAILAVEKGQPGDRAFAAAFEVWKESPLPSPPSPPAAAKAVLPPGYLDYAPKPTPGWVPNKTQPRNVVIFCAPLSADNAPDPIVRVSVTLSIPSNGAPPSFFDVVHGSLGGKFYKRSEQYAISRSVLNNGLGWQWLGQRLNGPSKWMVGELTPTDSKHYRYREWLYDADPRVIGLSRGQLVTLAACEEAP
jgi:hypothetical protein